MDLNPNNLDLDQKWKEVTLTPQGRENVWSFLHSYFQNASSVEDKKAWLTQFRWYTYLTWKRINLLSNDDLVKVAIGRQSVMALLLDFDVQADFFDYLIFRCPGEEDQIQVYKEVKNAFLKSEAYLGKFQNKDYTLQDLFVEVNKLSASNKTSIDKAAVFEKVTKILFPKDNELFNKYITADPTSVVNRLISFIDFLNTTKDEDIPSVLVRNNLEIEKEINSKIKLNQTKMIKPAEEKEKSVAIDAPQALIKPSAIAKKSDQDKVITPRKLSYVEIKNRIENSFKKDQTGSFLNISAVLSELQKISALQGDPKIKDLYIFNEKRGAFEWNEGMLKV